MFLVAGIKTSAIDSRYKNNLLNVELSQTPDNRVSVLLVFEKPYTEPVKVIYKTDNEYNILLPETYHSITSVSTLNALNIRSANVKLVPYFNQDNSNGYTKITLQTTRPVVFNAHASYITTQIAQDDLIDKIEKDETLKITPTKVAMSNSAPKKQVKQTKTQKPAVVKTQKTATKVATKPQTQAKPQVKPMQQAQKPVQPVIVDKETPAVETLIAQNIEENKPLQENAPNQLDKPSIETAIPEQIAQNQNTINNQVSDTNSIIATLKGMLNQPQNVMIGAILLLIALLLKVSRKQTVPQKESRTIIPPHFEYEQETTKEDIPQEIKDLSWQEKYKFMKEKENNIPEKFVPVENNITEEQKEAIEDSNELEIIQTEEIQVAKPNKTATKSIDEVLSLHAQKMEIADRIKPSKKVDPFGFNNPPVNEGFEPAVKNTADLDDLSDISDIEPSIDAIYETAPYKEDIDEQPVDIEISEKRASNPIEPTLINQAKISKTKGFYLVKYENEVALMGYINEQIFLLHTFNNKQPSFVQTRLTEKQRGSEVYLVRTENFKSLIKVTKDNMQTVLNL